MADLTALQRWRRLIIKALPWLARIGLVPSGALAIKSAAGKIEIEGGGPALLRVGDVAWLILDPGIPTTTPPKLYYSTTSPSGPFSAIALVTVPGAPPNPLVDMATQIAPDGSKKVTCG
jgi:hypothetical protein